MTHAGEIKFRPSGAWAAIVSALIAVALYAVTMGGTYIYDDIVIVHKDPRVLQPALFYQLWTQPFFQVSVDKLYRPLVSSSFAIQNLLHGDRPWAFHAVNILLHAWACAMVALVAARLAGSIAAWISGVLFAVHPVHVEAVAGLVGPPSLRARLRCLARLLIFLKPGRLSKQRMVAIAFCFVAAVLCKEQGILLPLLLLFAYPLRGGWNDADTRKQLKIIGIVLCLICTGYLSIRERVASFSWDRNQLDWYVNPMILSTGHDRLLMPLTLLGRYTRLLIFPSTLSIDYGGDIIGWMVKLNDLYLYLGIAALLAWFVLLGIAWRRRRFEALFCLLSLGVIYGLIGNVVALIGTIFADRLMYLPSIFFILLVGIGAARLPRAIAITLLVPIALVASVRSFTYARLWNDPEKLYRYTLAIHPESERAALLLSNTYLKRGDWDRARITASEISRRFPQRWEPYGLWMDALEGAGQIDQAIAVADEGLGHIPQNDKLQLIRPRELLLAERDAAKK